MNRTVLLLLGALALFPVGCSLAPEYTRPVAPVPDAWPAGAAYREGANASSARPAELPWREFFADARLRQVIDSALQNNRDLRLAALNVEKARAYYGIQRAEQLPSVGAVGSGGRQRVPADLSQSGSARTSGQYSVSLGIASWEIDFFGRIASLKDRALEEYLATDEARRGAQVLLISGVAVAYVSLAAERETLRLVAATLDTQEAAYRLIRKRYDAGLSSQLDLRQAEGLVETARGEVARATQRAAEAENLLQLLVGSPVPPEQLPSDLAAIRPPTAISPGLPSEVLLLRPEVLAAERRLRAANANIGAARAAFFPRISLTGTIGTASAELSGLFGAGSGTWSFAPQVAVPVFDARTWSAYESTQVEREIAKAQYEKAIQAAFREVADALAAVGTLRQRIAAQQSLLDAVAEARRLSDLRYAGGIDSYLGVLEATRSLHGAQQGMIAVRLARYTGWISLYKVLGGGVI